MIMVIILIIFLMFAAIYDAESLDASFQACSSPVSCGKLHNIGYPFSVDGLTPPYCGRALVLHCGGNATYDYPLLRINENRALYQVLGIKNFTISLKIYHNNCSVHSVDSGEVHVQKGLTYSSSVEDFLLWYECKNSSVLDIADSLTCSDGSGNVTTYYRLINMFHGDTCKSMRIPVFRTELDNYLHGNESLTTMLRKGFEMDYPIEDFQSCLHCKSSGGVCGSSENLDFVCFCKDRSYTYTCSISDTGRKSGSYKLRIIIASASSAVAIVMLIVLAVILRKGRSVWKFAISWKGRRTENKHAEAFLRIYGSLAPKRYTYSCIKKITNSFKDKLGEGGYAAVYKGQLSDGCFVAVKLFKQLEGKGEDFINEVATSGKTNHVNVVSLLGFCFEGRRRALIYEFMPNGSLEKFTFRNGGNLSLPWEILFNIALGIAKGLDYLHQGCNERILHLDIKPHNILLDKNFCPKISDFGLAHLCPLQESTISMLEARGTLGYIAPEVFCRSFGNVSHKSDVYSYGTMVLNLVCGNTNTSATSSCSIELCSPEWIYDQIELKDEVAPDGIVDDEEKLLQMRMTLVSLWCIQLHPSNRPSMSQVVELLNGSLESIPMPPKPRFPSPPRLALIHPSETLHTE